ncbi:MAG: SHOCT domain-containing protein [Chloroflexi bacterium]|nr:SHOCT domain-containing protein [Chloroflexota bacterium]
MMGWGAGIGSMGWLGWFGPVAMLLFWAAVIGLGVWLVGGLFRVSTGAQGTRSTAVDTLKRRYAAGEITRDEYQEGRRLLGE